MRRPCLLLLLLAFLGPAAQAHIASNGFLTARVEGQSVMGSIEIAVRDVELAIGVDANLDGKVTWGELRGSEPRLAGYLQRHLVFSAQGQPCELQFQGLRLNNRVDGVYAWLPFNALCPAKIGLLQIHYTVLENIDPSHRGLLTLTAGRIAQTGVLGGERAQESFPVYSPERWHAFWNI
jgi:hypothetical protein